MSDSVVRNISELLVAAKGISNDFGHVSPWWRGQSRERWDLLPAVYRGQMAANERNLNARFRNMARSRHSTCPSSDNDAGWLFLAQHYGLPTRLLDWTESLLVATFFAVEDAEHLGHDAALYALDPMRLNTCQAATNIIFGDQNSTVAPLFKAAFQPDVACPDMVVGVGAAELDVRQMLQQSAFTIHGSNVPINQLPEAASFVSKIRIPKEAKKALLQTITFLGVRRSSLFPDLESLARELRGITFSLPI